MNTETNRVYDVLVAPKGVLNGKLTKVGTAYPTPKGAGFRCTLKAALPEGAQLVILPSRRRADQPATTDQDTDRLWD